MRVPNQISIYWCIFILSSVGFFIADARSIFDGTESWEPLVMIRDNTDTWTNEKPSGGWYITPIHGNVLPTTGKVVVTGWGRRQEFDCGSNGTRRYGVSWVVDPELLTGPSVSDPYYITPKDEKPQKEGHVLYCAGHTTLRGGHILYAGGAFYYNLSQPDEKEYGLNYSRVFDPETEEFTRIDYEMPLGLSWYPTLGHLPDGRVLVTGGFSKCCGGDVENPALNIFDPELWKKGENPWIDLVPLNETRNDTAPGMKDYTRLWVLTEPVIFQGIQYDVGMMGWPGRVVYVSTDVNTPKEKRFYDPNNFQRPESTVGAGDSCGWDSTSLISPTGEIFIMGGCGNAVKSAQIDLYNPSSDTWRTIDTGIPRRTPTTIILPTGDILIMNGNNPYDSRETLQAQIYNPFTDQIRTLAREPDNTNTERAYHNMAVLLKDGRVLVGGGVHQQGGIGCEQPNIRIFNPPYLNISGASRPTWVDVSEPLELYASDTNHRLEISYKGGNLTEQGGVALLAVNAFTHSYDQNGRYIALDYTIKKVAKDGTVTLSIISPLSPVAFPGEYLMFLISDKGVPSVGKHVRVQECCYSSGVMFQPSAVLMLIVLFVFLL